jgi:uncharacterized protein YndB with AHSA1/START domain
VIIPPAPDPDTTLVLRRTFTATRPRVFRAWITQQALEYWFKPKGMRMTVRALDVREGGSFHFEIENGSTIVGTYLHIVPPEKLVFTWSWESIQGRKTSENKETVVTLEFLERGQTTEIVLTHQHLVVPEQRVLLEGGWPSLLNLLDLSLPQPPLDL